MAQWLLKTDNTLKDTELDKWMESLKQSSNPEDEFMLSMVGNFTVSEDENEKTTYIKDEITRKVMMENDIPLIYEYTLSDMFDITFRYLNETGFFN